MTLQELIDELQTYAHEGYAQYPVVDYENENNFTRTNYYVDREKKEFVIML